MSPLGVVAEETAVRAADRAIGGFNVTTQKRALSHQDGARRIRTKCGNGMVCVVIIEATHHDVPHVGFVITVGVLEKNQRGSLRHVHPVM